MGILFKWNIEKVILLPFGALTIFNEDLNRSIFEEFLIVIMGPIFQIIFTLFVYYFWNLDEVFYYSLSILFFNLLPIYPLDGSKLLNLFLNKLISFKRSHMIIIMISVLTIFVLILGSDFNLIFLLILMFLFMRVIKEIKTHESMFNRFLLERYLKKYRFKKIKKIKSLNLNKMRRDYRHLFYDGFKYVSEGEILKKRFDFKGKVW